MNESQPKNPLHGVTLEHIINRLAQHQARTVHAEVTKMKCFPSDHSVRSR
ncbi:MAG: DUF2132 domain-containing protein [Planctomycetes bacterium]|nr:DUF2132 domain-containing protein [Planctomycetota bacterium]